MASKERFTGAIKGCVNGMSVKKLTNGKWRSYIRYKNLLGKVCQKKKESFRTKKEALTWEREFLSTHAGKAAPNLTYDELANRYFADSETRWKPLTYRQCVNQYRCHIEPLLGDVLVDDLTVGIVREFQTQILRLSLKPKTKQCINTLASQIFNFGVRYCGLLRNPFKVCPFKQTYSPREYHIWTQDQFFAFLHRIPFANGKNEHLKLFFMLCFFGGFRRGETLALTVEDFDFDNDSIRINKSKSDGMPVNTPKTTTSIRTVYMPHEVMMRVKSYIQGLYEPSPHQIVFHDSGTNIAHKFRQFQKLYGEGLPYIRLHDLRHSHASMLYDMGVSDIAIARRLGHKDTTQLYKTYAHLYNQRNREVADRLNALWLDKNNE